MSWHAVDALDDAVDATRRFLFPFSLVRWAKLALLVLLMGGGGGASANATVSLASDAGVTPPEGVEPDPAFGVGSGSVGSDGGTIPPDAVTGAVAEAVDPIALAVAAGAVALLIVAVSVASLSLRLVFYDALQTNRVRIWRPFLGRLRQSLGLFLFTAVLSAAAAAPVALGVLVAVAADDPTGLAPVDSLAGTLGSLSVGPLVALGLAGAALVAVAALALRFTYEFVVPTMIARETGVLGGWRRVWTVLRAEWAEVLVYLVAHVVVALGLSVVEGVALAFALALVAAVGGLALLLVAAALGGLGALLGTAAGAAAVALVALAGVAVLLALVLPVQVITRSYRIAYEVSTLGGLDRDLAPLHPDLDSGGRGSSKPRASGSSDPESDNPESGGLGSGGSASDSSEFGGSESDSSESSGSASDSSKSDTGEPGDC
ncbi:hypothetical protein ACFQMF_14005 [Halorubrum rutilum]|uniref:Membrane domain of glycerophosphoryl diester phosphodiesterase n=1 Tax=Halorubrum rutilum TaxID=1364933 RepID=A0ABD6ANJ1_9EURY|nr:hypothetical protein [Halorubrum rutilum]